MLATPAEGVPTGTDWRYEVKFDGYRALAYVRGGECRLVSRNGNDLTQRFAEVAKAVVSATKSPNAVLDGEVCRIDARGRASFSELQQGSGALVYYAFDLLELDGEPLVDAPLHERKRQLRKLLDGRNRTVSFSEDFDDGDALFRVAEESGLEGVVAKRAERVPAGQANPRLAQGQGDEERRVRDRRLHARVGQARGNLWLARARRLRGWRAPLRRQRRHGLRRRRDRQVAAAVGAAPSRLDAARRGAQAAQGRKGDVHWVEPKLVAQVRYGEWTHDRHLRHPAYLGLRDDKAPAEVVREDVVRRGKRELKLSNLDKLFWPDEGITKGDLLRYYREVAPVLVPHLAQRAFTMRRYPDGAYGKAFFQKDAPVHMPDWIPRFRAHVSARDEDGRRSGSSSRSSTTSSRCSGW